MSMLPADAHRRLEKTSEVLGFVCADGGACHHQCDDRCFRRECCSPFSDYVGVWRYEPIDATKGTT